jgi:hypothetical protein
MNTVRFIVAAALLCALGFAARGENLYLTVQDSIAIVLHANKTWDFARDGKRGKVNFDEPVTLEDGSELRLWKNGAWAFVGSSPARAGERNDMDTAFASAVVKRSSLADAKTGAMDEAVKRLADQLIAGTKHTKPNRQKLMVCIQNEDKDVESSDEQRNGTYAATVKLSMDAEGIRNVIECANSTGASGSNEEPSGK